MHIRSDGSKIWRNNNGDRHREDGPAFIGVDGISQAWYVNGKCHRIDGPALIGNGYQAWYINGICHRENGPAISVNDGKEVWYINGICHRENGPAIIRADGGQEWWINGKAVTEQVEKWMKRKNVNWPWDEETQVQFILTFS